MLAVDGDEGGSTQSCTRVTPCEACQAGVVLM